MTMNLSERISAAASHLETLRLRAASAALDGDEISTAELLEAQATLDTLRDAQSEQTRRQRLSEATDRQADRATKSRAFEAANRKTLDAIADAENAARSFVDALQRAQAANQERASAFYVAAGVGGSEFAPQAFDTRLSNLLISVMRTAKPGPAGGRFGGIAWPNTVKKGDAAWAAEEARVCAAYLKRIQKVGDQS